MKKLSLIIAALLLSLSSFATEVYLPFNGISYFFKASTNGTSATLMLENLEGEEVNFSIANAEGKVFMQKTVIASGKVKEDINFRSLPEGKYNFKLKFEDKMLVREFYITSNKTAVMMNYQLATSDQKFKASIVEDQLNLIIGNDVEGFVKLNLRTEDGESVYSTKFLAGAKNVKRFDLSTLPQGTYTTEMVIDGVSYSDSFSIIK
ncbi:hypothetical protein KMW28_16690 [Flammeovirga yaeyamensis]|uniref:Secretion system C-terminal sorting domain-containing protein n=1 Tax=Flammeovirga yaeyamensis TaxID=367791 RepID=A0AAX1N5F8_9BACT|nr:MULTISPECIES: hypothetical protein [Flammeovirga]ANQ51294.1 hypothetical protein MY04_3950 [Flammeovirga sp. MY04]MBB3698348.1 hypothetical protein [Flammeovirga yaeyamensis]NMF34299.1 hypothetical protein [Flammeovirga yaeyamensis]QWG01282.1 hypothetical protein KMW28_16690 [Flammeovirga yaeyamensis]